MAARADTHCRAGFTCVPGIPSEVFMLGQQGLYPLSHLRSPRRKFEIAVVNLVRAGDLLEMVKYGFCRREPVDSEFLEH